MKEFEEYCNSVLHREKFNFPIFPHFITKKAWREAFENIQNFIRGTRFKNPEEEILEYIYKELNGD